MQAVYLTGPTVYLRAMVEDDKHHAAAWFDSRFPVNAARAEAFLKEKLQGDPWDAPWHLLAIVRRSDEAVGDASWLDLVEIRPATEDEGAIRVNRWFAEHPGFVLGAHALTRRRRRRDEALRRRCTGRAEGWRSSRLSRSTSRP